MKIVMVHDCAYVGYELRKELNKRGLEIDHVFFGGSPRLATLKMGLKLRRLKCDLIHAHFCRSPIYSSYLSGKPYIAHCHGSDVRAGKNWLQKRCLKKAKKVLVSTTDLLEKLPNATWLPNPVDINRFKPLRKHDGNRVLYFPRWYENLGPELEKTCARLGYELVVPKFYSIPYENLHLFLNEFDMFVDQKSIKSYSKTALEAMACGLPVIGFEHDLEKSLRNMMSLSEREKLVMWQNEQVLPKHKVKIVANQLLEIYKAEIVKRQD